MDTSAIFDFIDSFVYTRDKGTKPLGALISGEMTLDDFEDFAVQKRKAFDACVFQCLENDRLFAGLSTVYDRLSSLAHRYSELPFGKDYGNVDDLDEKLKGSDEYFRKKYHEIRGREIILAVKSLEKLLGINSQVQVLNECEQKDVIQTFSDRYNNEQLQGIFNYLIENTYLHSETDFNDFVYYFSDGKGELPKNHLKWCRNNTELALFICNTFPNEDMIWEKTKKIFGIDSNFATLANRSRKNATDKMFGAFIDEIKKKKNG